MMKLVGLLFVYICFGSLLNASDPGDPSNFKNTKPAIASAVGLYNKQLTDWLGTHPIGQDFLKTNPVIPNNMTEWKTLGDPLVKYQQFYAEKMAAKSGGVASEADLLEATQRGAQSASQQMLSAMGVQPNATNNSSGNSTPANSQQGSPVVPQQQLTAADNRRGASVPPVVVVDAELLAQARGIGETAAQADEIRRKNKEIQTLVDQLAAMNAVLRTMVPAADLANISAAAVDTALQEQEAKRAANSVGNATDALRLVMHASYESKDPGFDDQVQSVVSKTAFLQTVLSLRRMAESTLPVAEGGNDVRFGPINDYTFLPMPERYAQSFAVSDEMKSFVAVKALLEKSNMQLGELKKLVRGQAENATKKSSNSAPVASVTKDMQAVLSRKLLAESLQYLYPGLAPEVYAWSYFSRKHLEKASGIKFKDESLKTPYLEMVRDGLPSLVNCLESAAPTLSEKALSIFAEKDAKDDAFIPLTAFQLRALESELETASGKNCVVFFELMEAYTDFVGKNAAYQAALQTYFAASVADEELIYVARNTKMKMDLPSLTVDHVAISSSMRGFLQGLKIAESVYFCTDKSDKKIGKFTAVNAACNDFLESATKFMALLKTYAEKYHDKGVAILQASNVKRMDTVKILDSARVDKTLPVAKQDNGGFKTQMAAVFQKSVDEKALDDVDKSIKALNDKAEQGKKLLAVQADVDTVLTALTDPSVEAPLKAETSATGAYFAYKSLNKSELLIKAKLPVPGFVQSFFASINMKALQVVLERNLVDLIGNYGDGKTLIARDICKCVEAFAKGHNVCEVIVGKKGDAPIAVNMHAFSLLVYLRETFGKALKTSFETATKGTPPQMFGEISRDITVIKSIIHSANLADIPVADLERWLSAFEAKYPELAMFRFLSDGKIDKPRSATATAIAKQKPGDFVKFVVDLVKELIANKKMPAQPAQVASAAPPLTLHTGKALPPPPGGKAPPPPPTPKAPPAFLAQLKGGNAAAGSSTPLLGRDVEVSSLITSIDQLINILSVEERGITGVMVDLQQKRKDILGKITNLRSSYIRLTTGDTSRSKLDFNTLHAEMLDFNTLHAEIINASNRYFGKVSCEDLIDPVRHSSTFVDRMHREFTQVFEWMLLRRVYELGADVKADIDQQTQSAVDSAWVALSAQLPTKTLESLLKEKLLGGTALETLQHRLLPSAPFKLDKLGISVDPAQSVEDNFARVINDYVSGLAQPQQNTAAARPKTVVSDPFAEARSRLRTSVDDTYQNNKKRIENNLQESIDFMNTTAYADLLDSAKTGVKTDTLLLDHQFESLKNNLISCFGKSAANAAVGVIYDVLDEAIAEAIDGLTDGSQKTDLQKEVVAVRSDATVKEKWKQDFYKNPGLFTYGYLLANDSRIIPHLLSLAFGTIGSNKTVWNNFLGAVVTGFVKNFPDRLKLSVTKVIDDFETRKAQSIAQQLVGVSVSAQPQPAVSALSPQPLDSKAELTRNLRDLADDYVERFKASTLSGADPAELQLELVLEFVEKAGIFTALKMRAAQDAYNQAFDQLKTKTVQGLSLSTDPIFIDSLKDKFYARERENMTKKVLAADPRRKFLLELYNDDPIGKAVKVMQALAKDRTLSASDSVSVRLDAFECNAIMTERVAGSPTRFKRDWFASQLEKVYVTGMLSTTKSFDFASIFDALSGMGLEDFLDNFMYAAAPSAPLASGFTLPPPHLVVTPVTQQTVSKVADAPALLPDSKKDLRSSASASAVPLPLTASSHTTYAAPLGDSYEDMTITGLAEELERLGKVNDFIARHPDFWAGSLANDVERKRLLIAFLRATQHTSTPNFAQQTASLNLRAVSSRDEALAKLLGDFNFQQWHKTLAGYNLSDVSQRQAMDAAIAAKAAELGINPEQLNDLLPAYVNALGK